MRFVLQAVQARSAHAATPFPRSQGKKMDHAPAHNDSAPTRPSTMPECVLAFEDVCFSYDGTALLDGVTFCVRPGEIVALMGNNGSGKSTVAKLAEAFLLPTAGSVHVCSRSVEEAHRAGADGVLELRASLGLVMQNPDDQLVASIVVDEVAFGPSNLGLPRNEVVRRVQHALERVGMASHVGSNVNTLSGGQRQRVAIADALAMKPRLLIMDEPTSMLDEEGREAVRRIACDLRKAGMGILWITHAPEEAALADRVLTIEQGKVFMAPAAAYTPHPSAHAAAQASEAQAESVEAPTGTEGPAAMRHAESPLVSFRDVSFSYSAKNELGIDIFAQPRDGRVVFEHVSLDVFEGETIAIVGPNGCGKSTLLQLMNGLLSPTSGSVVVGGATTAGRAGANAARRTVGLCMQYPERSLFCQTVRDEVAFGPRNLGIAGSELEARVREAMDAIGLPYHRYADRMPLDLSGGEQRKVALAGVIAMRPKVLALDEPCAGLDAPAHARVLDALSHMKEQGQAIVIVTHDPRDVEALADRTHDMGTGRAQAVT